MRLVINTFLTVDGVMQAPGQPDEDRDGGFAHGGWSQPYFHDEIAASIADALTRADAFLLGRRTYDIFAAHWPQVSGDPISDALNSKPKYVASRLRETLEWHNSQVVPGDVVAFVRDLEAGPDGELNVQGSHNLLQTLIPSGLIDEYRFWVSPVLLGTGKRLFGSGTAPSALELVESRTVATGAVYAVYRPAGPVRTGSFALDA
jgi:dihydrofolate reductase